MHPDFSQLNLTNPSWDMFVAVLVIVLAMIYSALLGKNRIIVYSLSLFVALAFSNLVAQTPWSGIKVGEMGFSLQSIVFIGLTLILYFVLPKILPGRLGEISRRRKFWPGLVVGVFHTGFFIGLILSFLPVDFVNQWLPWSKQILVEPIALLVWGTMCIVAMAVVKDRHQD